MEEWSELWDWCGVFKYGRRLNIFYIEGIIGGKKLKILKKVVNRKMFLF